MLLEFHKSRTLGVARGTGGKGGGLARDCVVMLRPMAL